MLKKMLSCISIIFLSLSGNSAKAELSSSEIEAAQQAEINERIRAEQQGESIFCGQCDDFSSAKPAVISMEEELQSSSGPKK